MPKFEHIVLLSDGIRGHYHQSLGIAQWLEHLGSGELQPVVNVPKFSGWERFMRLKLLARLTATAVTPPVIKVAWLLSVSTKAVENRHVI